MIRLIDKDNVEPVSADYPYGSIKDNPGNGTGTPVNREVYSDFHQFFERMFVASGISANGLPDNLTNDFQLFEALLSVISKRITVRTVAGHDLDDFNFAGVFTVADYDSNIPSGLGARGTMIVSSLDGSLEFQQLIVDRTNAAMWIRTTTDGGDTWSVWSKINEPNSFYSLATGLNDIILIGQHLVTNANTDSPTGLNNSRGGILSVYRSAPESDTIKQIVRDLVYNGEWYRQSIDGGGSWSSWVMIKPHEVTVEIGDWNMDSTASVSVPHGISNYKTIKIKSVIVRDDSDVSYYDFLNTGAQGTNTGVHSGSTYVIDSANIALSRLALTTFNGWFDGTGFDSTGYNRGFITISYES